jgi:hypothetical protein
VAFIRLASFVTALFFCASEQNKHEGFYSKRTDFESCLDLFETAVKTPVIYPQTAVVRQYQLQKIIMFMLKLELE